MLSNLINKSLLFLDKNLYMDDMVEKTRDRGREFVEMGRNKNEM